MAKRERTSSGADWTGSSTTGTTLVVSGWTTKLPSVALISRESSSLNMDFSECLDMKISSPSSMLYFS